MPRIAPIDTAHAAAEVQATLSAVKAKIGMVPNSETEAIRINSPSQNDGSDRPLRLTTRSA